MLTEQEKSTSRHTAKAEEKEEKWRDAVKKNQAEYFIKGLKSFCQCP
jgi:hypothetical protein